MSYFFSFFFSFRFSFLFCSILLFFLSLYDKKFDSFFLVLITLNTYVHTLVFFFGQRTRTTYNNSSTHPILYSFQPKNYTPSSHARTYIYIYTVLYSSIYPTRFCVIYYKNFPFFCYIVQFQFIAFLFFSFIQSNLNRRLIQA